MGRGGKASLPGGRAGVLGPIRARAGGRAWGQLELAHILHGFIGQVRGRALSGGTGAGPVRPLAAAPAWGTPPADPVGAGMGMERTRHQSSHPWVSASQGSAPPIFSLVSSPLSGTRVRGRQAGRDPHVWRATSWVGEALSPCSTFCQRPVVTGRSPSRQRLGGGDTISISSQTSGLPLSRKVFSTGQRSSCGPSWLVTLGRP